MATIDDESPDQDDRAFLPLEELVKSREGRMLLELFRRLREAAPPAPEVTKAEYKLLTAILARGSREPHSHSSLMTDAPITDAAAARLVGSKNRSVVSSLRRKGLLTSYGPKHGSVPTALIHEKAGCVHWHSLTSMEQRVLSVFFDDPWTRSWSAREIAARMDIHKDSNCVVDVKKAIKKLCIKCVLRLHPSGRTYEPCSLHWPVDALGSPTPPPRSPYRHQLPYE